MPLLHLLILAILQGATEFLPVSSSAHLILAPRLLGWADQGVALDVAVHVGSLFAVMFYYRRDTAALFMGGIDVVRGRFGSKNARLFLFLGVATVPVVILGFALKTLGLVDALRSLPVIGTTMILFGALLYVIDKRAPMESGDDGWTWRSMVIMGLWQALALVPGTSRSGATITGGRALGFKREAATRMAMLMSIPTIIASGILLALDARDTATPEMLADAAIGAAFSFVAALIALSLMVRFLNRVSFTPYIIYRIVLGVILLVISVA